MHLHIIRIHWRTHVHWVIRIWLHDLVLSLQVIIARVINGHLNKYGPSY